MRAAPSGRTSHPGEIIGGGGAAGARCAKLVAPREAEVERMSGTADETVAAPARAPGSEDAEVVRRLREGDEEVFRRLVAEWSPAMLHLARGFVGSAQSAEDVVQDAWLGVLRGLDAFEGRSSLRSWVFTIVVNRARTRGVREARTVAWSPLGADDAQGPTVDPARFQGPEGRYPGHWTSMGAPTRWDEFPERSLLAKETLDQVQAALQQLPPRQRLVVTLRDVDGLSSEEVCDALGVSPENQRVLLHRGRAALRARLEEYYRGR
jgi:RNA polymerase sigma-70 factor (ECF subfamily)